MLSESTPNVDPTWDQKTAVSLQVLVFLRLVTWPHNLTPGLSSNNERDMSCDPFHDHVLWFMHILLVTQAKASSVCEHAIQRYEHQEARLLGLRPSLKLILLAVSRMHLSTVVTQKQLSLRLAFIGEMNACRGKQVSSDTVDAGKRELCPLFKVGDHRRQQQLERFAFRRWRFQREKVAWKRTCQHETDSRTECWCKWWSIESSKSTF